MPEPVLDAEDAPLPEGEAVALPVPSGKAVTLRFPSSFESWLTLGGERVREDTGPEARELLLWASRRLPALSRALEERLGLRGVFVPPSAGSHAHVVVTDLVQLDDGEFLDHGLLRERLESANVELARFSLLGLLSTKVELDKRVRATWAPGTLVELRVEDGRRVVNRRRFRVGR
jgi:hypothetical protein